MPFESGEFRPRGIREPQAAPAPQEDVSHLDVLAAQFAEQWYANGYRFLTNHTGIQRDPDYRPLEAIKGTPYEAYPMTFAFDRNAEETQVRMREMDEARERRSLIARSGAAGQIYGIGVGIIDPVNFIPLGRVFTGAAKGVTAMRLGADAAISGAAVTAATEAVNLAAAPEYTLGDAAMTVGSATLLSGLLGAGVGAFVSRAQRQSMEALLHQDRIDIGNDFSPAPQAGGAAPSDTRAVELVKTPLDKGLDAVRNVLPESARTFIPKSDFLGWLSPSRRGMNSELVSARRTVADLVETPYITQGNEQGVATMQGPALDRLMKQEIRRGRVGLSDTLNSTFYRYKLDQQDPNIMQRFGTGVSDLRGRTGGKLTYPQFKDAIDEALRSGDTHAIPEVTEAAQWIRREIIDPWKDRAIAAGMLPDDVKPETAASYMMRNWNKQKITAQRPEAVRRFADWYESEQTRKRAIQEKLTGMARQLDEAEGSIAKLLGKAKGGSQEHLDQVARVDTLRGQIEAELKEFKGNSANEALSAIKTRDATAGDPAKPRLTSADKAVSKAMRKIIDSDRNLSRTELEARANETIDRILGNPDGRLAYDDASLAPGFIPTGDQGRGPLASRDFMIPDELIRDLLETDIEETLQKFMQSIIPDVLLTEKFGDVDMTEAFRKLRDEHAALSMAAKTEKQRAALKKQHDAAVTDIAAMRDRVRGTYGMVSDPRMRMWGRVASNITRWNQLTDMGTVIASSVPDMGGVTLHYGFENALKHQVRPLLRFLGDKQMQELAKASKAELRAMGIGIDAVLQTRRAAITDGSDLYQPVSRFERGLDKASNAYFVANLLTPWTDAMQRIAGTVSMDQMSKAVEAVAAGKATKRQISRLAEAGIDAPLAGRIWTQLTADGGSNVIGGTRVSNTGAWVDKGARDAFEGAIARDVDMMVVSPGAEKPLFLTSSPTARLLMQYKTFVQAASERILFRGAQARDIQVLTGMAAMVALGAVGEYVYSLASGKELPKTTGDWVKAGVDRSGVTGWLGEMNAISNKWGWGDAYSLVGAESEGSRYGSREGGGILLGPTWNKAEGLIKSGGNAVNGRWADADERRLRRLVPFQNYLGMRRMWDDLGRE